jgi:hypothetical protein
MIQSSVKTKKISFSYYFKNHLVTYLLYELILHHWINFIVIHYGRGFLSRVITWLLPNEVFNLRFEELNLRNFHVNLTTIACFDRQRNPENCANGIPSAASPRRQRYPTLPSNLHRIYLVMNNVLPVYEMRPNQLNVFI